MCRSLGVKKKEGRRSSSFCGRRGRRRFFFPRIAFSPPSVFGFFPFSVSSCFFLVLLLLLSSAPLFQTLPVSFAPSLEKSPGLQTPFARPLCLLLSASSRPSLHRSLSFPSSSSSSGPPSFFPHSAPPLSILPSLLGTLSSFSLLSSSSSSILSSWAPAPPRQASSSSSSFCSPSLPRQSSRSLPLVSPSARWRKEREEKQQAGKKVTERERGTGPRRPSPMLAEQEPDQTVLHPSLFPSSSSSSFSLSPFSGEKKETERSPSFLFLPSSLSPRRHLQPLQQPREISQSPFSQLSFLSPPSRSSCASAPSLSSCSSSCPPPLHLRSSSLPAAPCLSSYSPPPSPHRRRRLFSSSPSSLSECQPSSRCLSGLLFLHSSSSSFSLCSPLPSTGLSPELPLPSSSSSLFSPPLGRLLGRRGQRRQASRLNSRSREGEAREFCQNAKGKRGGGGGEEKRKEGEEEKNKKRAKRNQEDATRSPLMIEREHSGVHTPKTQVDLSGRMEVRAEPTKKTKRISNLVKETHEMCLGESRKLGVSAEFDILHASHVSSPTQSSLSSSSACSSFREKKEMLSPPASSSEPLASSSKPREKVLEPSSPLLPSWATSQADQASPPAPSSASSSFPFSSSSSSASSSLSSSSSPSEGRFSTLRQRFSTGISLLLLAVPLLLFSPPPLFLLGALLQSLVSIREFSSLCTKKGIFTPSLKIFFLTSALIFLAAASPPLQSEFHLLSLPVSVVFLLSSLLLSSPSTKSIADISSSIFSLIWFVFLPSFWVKLRFLRPLHLHASSPSPSAAFFSTPLSSPSSSSSPPSLSTSLSSSCSTPSSSSLLLSSLLSSRSRRGGAQPSLPSWEFLRDSFFSCFRRGSSSCPRRPVISRCGTTRQEKKALTGSLPLSSSYSPSSLLFFSFLALVSSDTFAYLVGSFYGKSPISSLFPPPLFSSPPPAACVSPRKTVQGLLAGCASSALVGALACHCIFFAPAQSLSSFFSSRRDSSFPSASASFCSSSLDLSSLDSSSSSYHHHHLHDDPQGTGPPLHLFSRLKKFWSLKKRKPEGERAGETQDKTFESEAAVSASCAPPSFFSSFLRHLTRRLLLSSGLSFFFSSSSSLSSLQKKGSLVSNAARPTLLKNLSSSFSSPSSAHSSSSSFLSQAVRREPPPRRPLSRHHSLSSLHPVLVFLADRRVFGLRGVLYSLGALSGAVLSLLGVLGDLTASLVKRDAGVKDSGNFLPGHGGWIDRTDSFLLTAPFAYFLGLLTEEFFSRVQQIGVPDFHVEQSEQKE